MLLCLYDSCVNEMSDFCWPFVTPYFFYASSSDLLEPGFCPFHRKRILAKGKVSISSLCYGILKRADCSGIIRVKVSAGWWNSPPQIVCGHAINTFP